MKDSIKLAHQQLLDLLEAARAAAERMQDEAAAEMLGEAEPMDLLNEWLDSPEYLIYSLGKSSQESLLNVSRHVGIVWSYVQPEEEPAS